MVVGAFPLAKLGVLLVRQISKPIAGYIKERAKRSHTFRNYICLPTAQFYHWSETRYKLWVMGFGKPSQVTPLNEQMAVELGADILAEAFLFTIAAAGLTAEYIRSSANTRAKEEAHERRMLEIEARLVELDLSLEQQRAQLREHERKLHASPLRALKEAFAPSSSSGGSGTTTGQKPSSGGGSTIIAPPGTRVVTLEWEDAFPKSRHHSRHDANYGVSESFPVPQWKRPFVGPESTLATAPPLDAGASENINGNGGVVLTSKNGQSTSLAGTVSESNPVASNIASLTDKNSDSVSARKPNDMYTQKLIRRALKILINAYEEIEDD